MTAVDKERLTIDDILRLCYTNPKKIFLKHFDYSNNRSVIEIDLKEEWGIENENLITKSKWTPFDGWKVKGKVKRVFLRCKKVFGDGKVLAKPGSGKILP